MKTNDKNMKVLISGLMSGDLDKITKATRELTESIIVDRESLVIECLLENIKEETNV